VIIEKLKRQNRFFLTDKSIEKAESLSNKMAQPAATLISINLFSEIEQKFNELEKAVKQINISDPSFFHKKILSPAFGPGIQCNFTGMLHLNITIERIQDELGQQIIVSPAQTSLLARNKKDSRS